MEKVRPWCGQPSSTKEQNGTMGETYFKNFIETTKKFFTFDVSTSIRGLHQKKLVLASSDEGL